MPQSTVSSSLDAEVGGLQPRQPPSVLDQLRAPRSISKQVAEARSLGGSVTATSAADLPQIYSGRRRFILEEQLRGQRAKRGRSSWIKDHGDFLMELDASGEPASAFWYCRRCDDRGRAEFFACKATTSAGDHLQLFVISLLFLGLY